MRKLLLLLAISAMLFACKNSDEYVLNGSVKGVADGKKVTLEKQNESMGIMMPVDTAKIEKGKFSFKGKIQEPGIYFIGIEGVQAKSFVILEHGDIDIAINKDSVFLNKITGTYNNEQLTELNTSGIKVQKKLKAFQDANRAKMQEAMTKKDTAVIKDLRTQYQEIQKEMKQTTEKYVEQHPKSFVSVLLLQTFMNSYDADFKKIEGYYNNLDADIKATKIGKSIAKKIAEMKTVTVGRKAPDFSASDVNGKKVSLSESIGRITIIDFWASWCAPCRAESPKVVALYNEFHSKGLNIVGVSLDKDATKWKDAIAKDGLNWTQISNLKEWEDPIAATYGVKAIPATFILNQYGVVVAKDLHGDALRAKIVQMLGENKTTAMIK
jgi:peroxiredoxin/ElaB/YqjD/DUF883 family membrane-anchored ribosome-binding protein